MFPICPASKPTAFEASFCIAMKVALPITPSSGSNRRLEVNILDVN